MTDKELLQMAAKAAGYAAKEMVYMPGDDFERRYLSVDSEEWNPLEDDGDALRLALKLELAIQTICGIVIVTNIHTKEEFSDAAFNVNEIEQKTRRCIVRAAAEIGRAMP